MASLAADIASNDIGSSPGKGRPGPSMRSALLTSKSVGSKAANENPEAKATMNDSQMPGKKIRKRDRFLSRSTKSKKPGVLEKDSRKPSVASDGTMREPAAEVPRSPDSSQYDLKSSTSPLFALTVIRDIRVPDAANDGEVTRQFKELEFTVTGWSAAFASSLADEVPAPSDEDLDRLQLVAPGKVFSTDLRTLLQHPADRRQVTKGYVYRILYERIFSIQRRDRLGRRADCTDFWISKQAAQAVYMLESIFEQEIETADEHDDPEQIDAAAHITPHELHTWRSYTMSLLSHTCVAVHDAGSTQFQEHSMVILKAIWRVVGVWLPTDKQSSAHASLNEIITKAIMLMRLLRQQRAYWTIAYPDWFKEAMPKQLLFDPVTMHARDNNHSRFSEKPQESLRNRPIELMIRPALFKRGDASGGKLDIETCLVRAEVRCQDL